MAILQVRDLNDGLYFSLKQLAQLENRSISQEVISILEKYLSNPTLFKNNPTQEFLKLSSSWEDSRNSEDIISDIKINRKIQNVLSQIMSYLIDTDIIIYSIKGNEVVHKNFLKYQNYPKSISIVTYGELLFGAKKSQNVDKNLAVVYRIKELFPVIGIDKPIIETFSGIKLSLRKEGNPIDDMDLLIASTALTLNLTVVTNNEKHFKKIKGLKLENWSKAV